MTTSLALSEDVSDDSEAFCCDSTFSFGAVFERDFLLEFDEFELEPFSSSFSEGLLSAREESELVGCFVSDLLLADFLSDSRLCGSTFFDSVCSASLCYFASPCGASAAISVTLAGSSSL